MLGDFIIWLKKSIQQQTCIHDYKTVHRRDLGGGSFEKCKKCGRICK